jgi:protein-arginine deiminase
MRYVRRVVLAVVAVGALVVPMTAAVGAGPVVTADLRADVDRDGQVSTDPGAEDDRGEELWSRRRGAVFLPNLDDDSRRCPYSGGDGKPLPDAALGGCQDAGDRRVNGPADALDLARLRTVPMPYVGDKARGTIRVLGTAGRYTRLFLKRGSEWEPMRRLDAAELRAGAEIGMEGTDVVRNRRVWDGTARVRFSVEPEPDAPGPHDDVTLRVAPVLTHHHLQQAQQVLVKQGYGDPYNDRIQRRFVAALRRAVRAAGIRKHLVEFTDYDDQWLQDFVEPAYVQMPAPWGMQTMRVMLRSAQDREPGVELYKRLRGPDTAVLEPPGHSGDYNLNSLGNLETIPPYRHNGRSYPAGRIIMGEIGDTDEQRPAREMREMLAAQGMQDPLLLDTSWLWVGHVDEFVQFLPARTARGWRVAVADPRAGMAILDRLVAERHGDVRMFSWPGDERHPAPQETVAEAAASPALRADNEHAADRIDTNLERLRDATGLTESEILRVPQLYTRGTLAGEHGTLVPFLRWPGVSQSALDDIDRHGEARDDETQDGTQDDEPRDDDGPPAGSADDAPEVLAYVPGAVNGLLLAPDRYLAPKQWGPVVAGRDVFADAVTAAYRSAGIRVSYIDDFASYHLYEGEVHCGTNTLRDTSPPWWRGV